ncbi:MAG TPA: hypothetical protein VEL76_19930 [Gemmataceae bacterium]|nr:hypothetical protein [Gemmataceae bacterium]
MAEAQAKPRNLVLSYTIARDGEVKNHEPIQQALEAGYEVADLISVAVEGGANSPGFAAVTVVLTLDHAAGPFQPVRHPGDEQG